jgi:uncharacterized protein
MKFSEELGDAAYRITGYGEGWVRVNQERLAASFILTPQSVFKDWQPQRIEAMETSHLEPLFAIPAEVIIIGCGATQQFPPTAIWKALVQHGTGFEIMTTDAACRTYNVLLSEARPVVAAFFI